MSGKGKGKSTEKHITRKLAKSLLYTKPNTRKSTNTRKVLEEPEEPEELETYALLTPDIINDIQNGYTVPVPDPELELEDETNISNITENINRIPDALPIEKWVQLLYSFIRVSDGMAARGGDLIHDIGRNNVNMPIPATGMNMINFINSRTHPSISGAVTTKLINYSSNIASIIRDFKNFRQVGFPPKQYNRKVAANLEQLTIELRNNGVNTIVLDAQFGNIFKDGFGRDMTLLMSTSSKVDGASKMSQKTATTYGIRYAEDNTQFTLPYLYENVRHSITHTSPNLNRIIINDNGTNLAISCKSGISVNAVCKNAGLPIPRKYKNYSGKDIIMDSADIQYGKNHIVMIKTMTDWAQLAYAKLLTMHGIGTVFITNDQYCLALAAVLGLPYVIQTPTTDSDFINYYEFDVNYAELTNEQRIVILQKLILTPDYKAILNKSINDIYEIIRKTSECFRRSFAPDAIKIRIISKLDSVKVRAREIIDEIIHLNAIMAARGVPTVANDPAININKYRQLLQEPINITTIVNDFIKLHMTNICVEFLSFGSQLQRYMNIEINTNINIFINVVQLVVEFCTNDVGVIEDIRHPIEILNSLHGDQNKAAYFPPLNGDTSWNAKYTRAIRDAISELNLEDDFNVEGFPIAIIPFNHWSDQGSDIKKLLYFVIDKYANTLTRLFHNPCILSVEEMIHGGLPFPGFPIGLPPVPPNANEIMGGGKNNNMTEENNDNSFMTNTDLLNNYVTYVFDTNYKYKPSCSNNVSELINSLALISSDPSKKGELATRILEILQSMSIDANESNIGDLYEIKLLDIQEYLDNFMSGTITAYDFALYVMNELFNSNSVMFVLDVLSGEELSNLLKSLNTLGGIFGEELPVLWKMHIQGLISDNQAVLAKARAARAKLVKLGYLSTPSHLFNTRKRGPGYTRPYTVNNINMSGKSIFEAQGPVLVPVMARGGKRLRKTGKQIARTIRGSVRRRHNKTRKSTRKSKN